MEQPTATELYTSTWDHVNLNDVDPSFQSLDEGWYNLRLVKAEKRKFVYKPEHDRAGETDAFITLSFTIVNHPKFSGRYVFPSPIFPNGFGQTVARKLQDETGINQSGDTEAWLKTLVATGPVLKCYVYNRPDEIKGQPNPRTMKADGSASLKADIDWKRGIQSAD